jgi:uncharacterized protein
MTFAEIPGGCQLFVDANTFIYHFIAEPNFKLACTSLLKRIQLQEIEAWTSSHVLAEISHRLMTIEACTLFGWPWQGIATRLRNHPDNVRQLSRYKDALDQIALLPIRIMGIDSAAEFSAAVESSRPFGLLTNDALVVAQMSQAGLVNLASNDADFDRVPGLTRFAPI